MKDLNSANEAMRLTSLLREQLNEMMAASQALARSIAKNSRALDYMAVLERGMFRQLRLIRQLELEQKLNGLDEVRLFRAPVDLVKMCLNLMEHTDRLVSPLGIRAQFSSALAALPALADRAALEEMLLALISNSVKAICRDGSILLELEQRDRKAVFTLTDNGGGMDCAALSALFDPPETDGEEDDPPEDLLAHRGRGLSLAQQIAALHGGILIVDSKQSKGVRLAISIPLVSPMGGVISSSDPNPVLDDTGGWDRALVALSDCLPPQVFLPEVSLQ